MIIANMTPTARTVTFRADSSTYQIGEVRDYFTNRVLATATNNTFTVTVSGAGLGTGSMALKLMPR